ncbi:lipopolysaccharide biosynthesis protein [Mucilaginibacter galii]|uniref:Polysaccharide biosynthesis protein n=1 Tax=Mucilaginibacter galii TaxID=2005073 RepID=A0A917JDL7_9SPHI|nr:polysaccharide biosynthesis protein [Mucilaginibacter galii]GGI52151.1 hypothetical protein GCM10011425_33630 [Mucilaginibacter galii]
MKEVVENKQRSAIYNKSILWFKLFSVAGFAQIIVQGIGLVSGILIIRLLSTQEYALYTLVNTVLGTMTILADGGIGTSVLAQGGKVWKDPVKLGTVLVTGFHLRKRFAVISLLITTPALLYLLIHNKATWFEAGLTVAALIPAFTAQLSDSLLELAPKLQQDIKPLQINQISVGVLRLILITVLIFFFPFAYIAIIATGIPRAWGNYRLRKISKGYANWDQKPDNAVKEEIYKVVKRLMPTGIYYCISSQVSIWLISLFGSTTAIAQIGALGRLSILLTILTNLINQLIIPRFARLPNTNPRMLTKRYLQTQGILVIIILLTVGAVWLWPHQILWIIGKKYANLEKELVLTMLSSCVTFMAGVSFTLYTSRGWAIAPYVSIPINIFAISIAAWLLDVGTVQGVLLLNIFTALVQVVMNSGYILRKISKLKDVDPQLAV